jgi:hypothetical protein
LRFIAHTVRLQLNFGTPRDPQRNRESDKRHGQERYIHATDHLPEVAS